MMFSCTFGIKYKAVTTELCFGGMSTAHIHLALVKWSGDRPNAIPASLLTSACESIARRSQTVSLAALMNVHYTVWQLKYDECVCILIQCKILPCGIKNVVFWRKRRN
jgi:hypothetical protein